MKAKLLLAALGLFYLGLISAAAQRGFTEFETEDEIKVMYRWQRAVFFLKNSDAVLGLRVTNLSDSPVKWTYSVAFYNDKMLTYESETSELCLLPGQSRRGSLAGLRYTVEGMKKDEVESDSFSWDFGTFRVEEVESCE
ncbi:MAG: hypothetical protein ACOCX0_03965 [Bacteroidota bacterium]